MSRSRRAERGSALIMAAMMIGILLMMVVFVLSLANRQRRQAITEARSAAREGCARTGLQLARSYFANNFGTWGTYLNAPGTYDPIPGPAHTAATQTAADPHSATLQADHPELFQDLDGDGKADVMIFIRDNEDEYPPATLNWLADNDQNAIVGALCISETIAPRRDDGLIDPNMLMMESLLSFNVHGSTYGAQAGGGASGTGNVN